MDRRRRDRAEHEKQRTLEPSPARLTSSSVEPTTAATVCVRRSRAEWRSRYPIRPSSSAGCCGRQEPGREHDRVALAAAPGRQHTGMSVSDDVEAGRGA